jgi:DnaJ-class molecular chaperone
MEEKVMIREIVREYGTCQNCRGSGKVAQPGNSNPLIVILSLGTSLNKNFTCQGCKGEGKVVIKEVEIIKD